MSRLEYSREYRGEGRAEHRYSLSCCFFFFFECRCNAAAACSAVVLYPQIGNKIDPFFPKLLLSHCSHSFKIVMHCWMSLGYFVCF